MDCSKLDEAQRRMDAITRRGDEKFEKLEHQAGAQEGRP